MNTGTALWQGLVRALGGSRDELELHRIGGLEAYRHFVATHPGSWDEELALATRFPDVDFTVGGHCWVDDEDVAFRMDYLFATDLGHRRVPNWRERMVCPLCGMNNRQRAALHVASEALGLRRTSRVYMTEQVSSAFAHMRKRHPSLIGSEFVGPGVEPGHVGANGVRHEDVMRLSLADGSLDAILTFDVLEHVPDYRRALAECHRVLAPGGGMLFSIPFMEDAPETRQRAELRDDGALVHLQPAAYHGDPLNPAQGVLCFHDFGWDILDAAKAVGFDRAEALTYRSRRYGYLGGWQLLFIATRR